MDQKCCNRQLSPSFPMTPLSDARSVAVSLSMDDSSANVTQKSCSGGHKITPVKFQG